MLVTNVQITLNSHHFFFDSKKMFVSWISEI